MSEFSLKTPACMGPNPKSLAQDAPKLLQFAPAILHLHLAGKISPTPSRGVLFADELDVVLNLNIFCCISVQRRFAVGRFIVFVIMHGRNVFHDACALRWRVVSRRARAFDAASVARECLAE
jgi:hypothetical protein